MKIKLRLLILLLSISTWTFAQHTFTWQRAYGNPNLDDMADDIIQTSDGDYVFTGSTNGSNGDDYDIYLVKTDRVGNVLWSRTFGGGGTQKGAKMVKLEDGGFAIAGMNQNFGENDSDVFLLRTDAEGIETWSMTYRQADTNEAALGLAATADGGFIISGYAESATGDEELYLIKTRENGSIQWSNQYGGLQDERGYAVVTTSDGGYAVAGFTQSIGNGKKDGFLLKTDFVGNEMWARSYGNSQNNQFYDLVAKEDGGFVMTGANEFAAYVPEDMYVVGTDALGAPLWNRSFGGSFKVTGYSITTTNDGGFLVAGERHFMTSNNSKDIFLMRLSQTGIPIWERTHSSHLDEGALAVTGTLDGGFIVAGWQNNRESFVDTDAFLLKTNLEGQIDTTFTVLIEQSESFTCHGEDSGTIDVWVTGGQYPYTYDWNQEDIEGFHLNNLPAGNYTVTVTGADHQTHIQQSSFLQPPRLALNASPTAPETCAGRADGRAIAFASGGTGEFTYLWDNGETEAFNHNLEGGLHEITVTDENGCTTVAAVLITAGPDGKPSATFEFETQNLDLTFTSDIVGEASEIVWDFGDGHISNQANPNHSFIADGTYQVCLTVSNTCGSEQTCQTINVFSCSDDPLSASFDVSSHSFTANFSHPSAENADAHLWDFGDGNTSTEATPTHTFSTSGTYEICLTVSNLCGEHQQCMSLSFMPDPNAAVIFRMDSIRSLQDTTVHLPVYVQSFNDVAQFQGSIQIEDIDIAHIKSVGDFNLPNFNENNFDLETAKTLSFYWTDEAVEGLSLEDDTPIFTIELFLAGASGACTFIKFSDSPLPFEVKKVENETLVESAYETHGGEICRIDQVQISGTIKRENGTLINDAVISCAENTYESNFDGEYDFPIPAGETCNIHPVKNTNHSNGVSTFDIALIRKHILNVSRLNSPYKMIAADVNGSGTISGLDMVIIRKMVLNDIDEFPDAPSWRFVPADFVFPNPANAFETEYPVSIWLRQTDRDFPAQDFIAIKTGDVNYSAIPNLTDDFSEERSASPLTFELAQQDFKAGEMVRLPLRSKDFQQVIGFQFDLNINSDILDFQNIQAAQLSDFNTSNFNYKNENLALSWTSTLVENGLTLQADDVLFYLEFQALKNGQITDALSVNPTRINAEVYNKDLEIFELELAFIGHPSLASNLQASVYPNPVQSVIHLSYQLAESGFLQMDLFDSKGQFIKTLWTNTFVEKGRQEKLLNVGGLDNGVYHLVLQSTTEKVIRKIVKVE